MTTSEARPEAPSVQFTEEQERHARKLFERFDFNHRIFAGEAGSQATVTGRLLLGYRVGLARVMDVIDGNSAEQGMVCRSEALDFLAQEYVGRQLKSPHTPDFVIRQIRDDLAFVDFAIWRRLEEELAKHGDDYPNGFMDGLEPPCKLPDVPRFVDSSIP